MSHARTFRKCSICGTHGHSDYRCPVRDLNDEQERASRVIVKRRTNVIVFAKPELTNLVQQIQMKWSIQLGVRA